MDSMLLDRERAPSPAVSEMTTTSDSLSRCSSHDSQGSLSARPHTPPQSEKTVEATSELPTVEAAADRDSLDSKATEPKPDTEVNDTEVRKERERRRNERRRRSHLSNTEIQDIVKNAREGQPDSGDSPAILSPTRTDRNITIQSILDEKRTTENSEDTEAVEVKTGRSNTTDYLSEMEKIKARYHQKKQSELTTIGVPGAGTRRSSLDVVSDSTTSSDLVDKLKSRRMSVMEDKTDINEIIRDVQKTGREIEKLGSDQPEWSAGSNWLQRKGQGLDTNTDKVAKPAAYKSILDEPPLSPITPTRKLPDPASSLTDKAMTDHVSGRWRDKVRLEDVQEASMLYNSPDPSQVKRGSTKNYLQNRRKARPFSTYDNVPGSAPQSGDILSVVTRRFSNTDTDTPTGPMSPISGPVSPETKRWGRVFSSEEENQDSENSLLKRSATLPRRWRSNLPSERYNRDTADVIAEEGKSDSPDSHCKPTDVTSVGSSFRKPGDRLNPTLDSESHPESSVDRFSKMRRSLRLSSITDIEKEDGGVVLAAPSRTSTWKSNLDTTTSSNVPDDRNALGKSERFRALSMRYQDDSDSWGSKPKENTETTALSAGDNVSPRTSRNSDDISGAKSDTDSVTSGRDEGFESESLSASQRTSMSSTLESELTGTPTLGRKDYSKQKVEELEEVPNYFSRSIDSLIHRPELTVSEVNIDGEAGSCGSDKTPTQEDKGLEVWQTEQNVCDLPLHLRQTISAQSPSSPGKVIATTYSLDTPTTGKKTSSLASTSKPTRKTTSAPSSAHSTPTKHTPKHVTPNSRFGSKSFTSPTASGRSTPTKGKSPASAKATADAVTARLTRPRKPAVGLTRQLSNSSVASDMSTASTTRSTASSKPRKPSRPSTAGVTSPRPSTAGVTSPRSPLSADVRSPPSSFVRGSATRATMPASVLRSNKKAAASDSKDLPDAPVPPKRTSSIRASSITERLAGGKSTSASVTDRLTAAKPTAASVTERLTSQKPTSASVTERLTAGKTARQRRSEISPAQNKNDIKMNVTESSKLSPKPTAKVSPLKSVPSRPGRISDIGMTKASDRKDKSPSFLKKMMEKKSTPTKNGGNVADDSKTRVVTGRPTLKSSRC